MADLGTVSDDGKTVTRDPGEKSWGQVLPFVHLNIQPA